MSTNDLPEKRNAVKYKTLPPTLFTAESALTANRPGHFTAFVVKKHTIYNKPLHLQLNNYTLMCNY